jgi:hypothetical protein
MVMVILLIGVLAGLNSNLHTASGFVLEDKHPQVERACLAFEPARFIVG